MSFAADRSSPPASSSWLRQCCAAALVASLALPVYANAAQPSNWVSTWSASPQPVWDARFVFPTNIPAKLENQTIRQAARISLGGKRVRIVLSNVYGKQPLTIDSVHIALASGGSAIRQGSDHTVTFGGQTSAVIPAGAPLLSDPVELAPTDLATLAVSVFVAKPSATDTFHWDARQTMWLAAGNQVATEQFVAATTSTARLFLSDIQVQTPAARGTIAILGDSITDGACATLDANTRWPDFLAVRLAPRQLAVINAGISGARLLSDRMGVNALARFERDVLSQPGIKSVVVLLGINDISWGGTALDPHGKRPTLAELIAGYRQLIVRAHAQGVRVIGATLTPFGRALPDSPLDNYYNADKEALRQQVNHWIRSSGEFDSVVDFDQVLRDPAQPTRMQARFDSGDHLHPSDQGNRAMADAISLDTLLPAQAPTSQATSLPDPAGSGIAVRSR